MRRRRGATTHIQALRDRTLGKSGEVVPPHFPMMQHQTPALSRVSRAAGAALRFALLPARTHPRTGRGAAAAPPVPAGPRLPGMRRRPAGAPPGRCPWLRWRRGASAAAGPSAAMSAPGRSGRARSLARLSRVAAVPRPVPSPGTEATGDSSGGAPPPPGPEERRAPSAAESGSALPLAKMAAAALPLHP